MLSGEYAVLDGATCIGLPTKLGQHITVKPQRGSDLTWRSFDVDGTEWFKSKISLYDFGAVDTTDEAISNTLKKYLKGAVRLNCEFLDKWNGFKVETRLEFSKDWGLGSSSTVLDLIAQWADVDPLQLYFKVENGSGYDIICGAADKPITYQISEDSVSYKEVDLPYDFIDQLYFVYTGKKQSSKQGIKSYISHVKNKKSFANEIDVISKELLTVTKQADFDKLIQEHESIVSSYMSMECVQKSMFPDFDGVVKSLGAWGGDFVLVSTSMDSSDVIKYFSKYKLDSVISFGELIRM